MMANEPSNGYLDKGRHLPGSLPGPPLPALKILPDELLSNANVVLGGGGDVSCLSIEGVLGHRLGAVPCCASHAPARGSPSGITQKSQHIQQLQRLTTQVLHNIYMIAVVGMPPSTVTSEVTGSGSTNGNHAYSKRTVIASAVSPSCSCVPPNNPSAAACQIHSSSRVQIRTLLYMLSGSACTSN